ncbi:YybH family protein [Aquimarina longa]|uniref:YybH family protein n=1 Tax=Aquimarina longa TaxID=1080221 RepID=UPI000781D7C5|nr:nuclear transport factor 2 family protein [Aquimarina longa]
MKVTSIVKLIPVLFFIIIITSCTTTKKPDHSFNTENETEAKEVLQKLLTSIENKNIESLQATLSPTGQMELILPKTATTYTVDEFVEIHKKWFKDSTWTMKTKILNIKSSNTIAAATTEAIYNEPDRNGVPYYNHMIVTYVLEKINGKWYVIKDHANSLKKSTD